MRFNIYTNISYSSIENKTYEIIIHRSFKNDDNNYYEGEHMEYRMPFNLFMKIMNKYENYKELDGALLKYVTENKL